MRLILMRHAKSDWGAGLRDFDRPLNPRGQRAATALGSWLRDRGHVPDEILCSAAKRTAQTCAGLALETKPDYVRALYHAEPQDMARVLSGATGRTVLVIGHNPGIGEWANMLCRPAPVHERFQDYPTGATLVLDVNSEDWATVRWGNPVDFIVPRDLTG